MLMEANGVMVMVMLIAYIVFIIHSLVFISARLFLDLLKRKTFGSRFVFPNDKQKTFLNITTDDNI